MQLYSPEFWQRWKKTWVVEKTDSLTNGAGETGYPHVKDWN
jgi:hypothetical protein